MTPQQQEKLLDYLDGLKNLAANDTFPIGCIRRPSTVATEVARLITPVVKVIIDVATEAQHAVSSTQKAITQGQSVALDCGENVPKDIELLLDAAANGQLQVKSGTFLVLVVDSTYDTTVSLGESVNSYCDLTT